MSDVALQDRYGAGTRCFGCGPANDLGLRIKSRVAGDDVVLDWVPEPQHQAFPGFVNGGIIGVLFDCHCNWTAAWYLMRQAGATEPPFTVTADYAVQLKKPTPSDGPLHLRARVVEATARRAVVEATLEAAGEVRATCRGTFVAVGPGHPAYQRW